MVRFFYHLVRGVETRNAALIQLFPPAGLFQPFASTSSDRYPDIFNFLREQIRDGPETRILSFGCSTGEEVFSLRRYFLTSSLLGIDINRLNIAVCRKKLRRLNDGGIRFLQAGSTTEEASASFDVILAMAVFRHGKLNLSPPPPACGHKILFADFESAVTDFARCLKSNGFLVIHNAMFRFSDTTISRLFLPIPRQGLCLEGPLYDSNNRILPEQRYPFVVFRKLQSLEFSAPFLPAGETVRATGRWGL
ncbi:MAG: class I SAM-dependent methyltransferase [Terracidiphilus sp.]